MSAEIQEIKRNWPVLALATIALGICVPAIPAYGFGMFMKSITSSFGWTLAQTSGGLAVASLAMAFSCPLVGIVVDRIGLRTTILFTMPIAFLACAGIAATGQSILSYYALWAIVGSFGMGSGPIIWTRLLSQRFTQARGLAMGIASSGVAILLLIEKPILQYIMITTNWQIAFVTLALLPLILVFPAALRLISSSPQAALEKIRQNDPPGADLKSIFRGWRFYVMLLAIVCLAGITGLIPHLESLIMEGGMSRTQAVELTSWMGIGLLIGRVGSGYLSDRFWAPGLLAALLAVATLSSLGLVMAHGSFAWKTICVVCIGLAAGGEFQLIAYITSRYFGLRHYGLTFGIFYGVITGFGGLWSVWIAKLAETGGGYTYSIHVVDATLTVSIALLLLLGRAPAKPAVSYAPA